MPERVNNPERGGFADWWQSLPFSGGAMVILLLAVASMITVAVRPSGHKGEVELWTSARQHYYMYQPVVDKWNQSAPLSRDQISMTLLSQPALEQRMLSGFLSGTPTAELLEVERRIAARAFAGPLSSVGFVDLTDRLKAEGLLDKLNGPSFSPWSSRGRIFGIPHDVHPVMLGYRADIIEAAGIDMSKVRTWNDLFVALAPLMGPVGPDGEPKRGILNFWPTHVDLIEVLLLQAGGAYFDDSGKCTVDSPVNRRVIASLAAWCSGEPFPKGSRIAGDAQDFTAAGNNRKINGDVLCYLMPDWMCGIYRHEMPQLEGKMKLMPLPAWSADGADGLSTRRTSVYGGTMLGISRTAVKSPEDFERFWDMAKKLYLSDELAETLWKEGEIIAPNKAMWSNPMFDKPDAFFGGQAKGRMYIDLAGDVPRRSSSPFFGIAQARVQDALFAVRDAAKKMKNPTPDDLMPETARQMAIAQEAVERVLRRNRFLSEGADGAAAGGSGGGAQ
jgi:arabinosaccharide transport system substrate-binding protein